MQGLPHSDALLLPVKKWLKDNTLEPQEVPQEIASRVYKVTEDKLEEGSKERFVVLRTIRTPTHSIQIAINDKAAADNNSYSLLVFDAGDNLKWATAVESHVPVPPVWDRIFSTMDYYDWLLIQHFLKKHPELADLEIDESTSIDKKLGFYFPRETDALERLRQGEDYSTCCIFATAMPELVERTRTYFAEKCQTRQ